MRGTGSAALRRVGASRIRDQTRLPRWQADSLPLSQQGSPAHFFVLTQCISERELTTQYRLVEKGLGVFSELESQGLESFSVAFLAATVPAAPKMQTHCDRRAGTSSVGFPSLGTLEGAWPGKAVSSLQTQRPQRRVRELRGFRISLSSPGRFGPGVAPPRCS